MHLLEFKNLSYTYQSKQGEVFALDNLNFTIEKEEFVAIVGPSGCGKTTILSLISKLLTKTSGQILINGKEDNTLSLGYMFQKDCLFPWRTITKNAMLGLEIGRKPSQEDKEYVLNLLNKYGLENFTDSFPAQLSGGMRQRVALIRTLATRPSLLLLDEPTSALDYQTRLAVCDDIHRIIRTEKKSAILVTHDISEAISLADKIIVLTKRPATVLNIHMPNFDQDTPLKRRECLGFPKLFETIYKELN